VAVTVNTTVFDSILEPFRTVTLFAPTVVGLYVAVNSVADTNTVGMAVPSTSTVEDESKFVPVTVIEYGPPFTTPVFGATVPIWGSGFVHKDGGYEVS
jgi:hypothetical protein